MHPSVQRRACLFGHVILLFKLILPESASGFFSVEPALDGALGSLFLSAQAVA